MLHHHHHHRVGDSSGDINIDVDDIRDINDGYDIDGSNYNIDDDSENTTTNNNDIISSSNINRNIITYNYNCNTNITTITRINTPISVAKNPTIKTQFEYYWLAPSIVQSGAAAVRCVRTWRSTEQLYSGFGESRISQSNAQLLSRVYC